MPDEPINGFFGEYRWLSNFWPAVVSLHDTDYPTVEHAYQAAKFNNPSVRQEIRAEPRPAGAKRCAKRLMVWAADGWEDRKLAVMKDLTRQKYRIPSLRHLLKKTGQRELIEGNTWGDTYWGVDLKTGQGFNALGKTIMEIRNEIYRGLDDA